MMLQVQLCPASMTCGSCVPCSGARILTRAGPAPAGAGVLLSGPHPAASSRPHTAAMATPLATASPSHPIPTGDGPPLWPKCRAAALSRQLLSPSHHSVPQILLMASSHPRRAEHTGGKLALRSPPASFSRDSKLRPLPWCQGIGHAAADRHGGSRPPDLPQAASTWNQLVMYLLRLTDHNMKQAPCLPHMQIPQL